MNLSPARAMRGIRKGPRYVAARVVGSVRRRLQRPWTRLYPRLLSDRALLRQLGAASVDELWGRLQRSPFFFAPDDRAAWTAAFVQRYPRTRDDIIAAAERVLAHEFDLLGSGPVRVGDRLPWHRDFKTGREWAPSYACDIEYNELDRPTDVKVPWELSRCQHFTVLGQAFWLTGDERYAEEFTSEVLDWIERNPWGYGVNWACAMDVALRAVSWIWGFFYMSDAEACRSHAFRRAFARSLFLHAEHITTHLECGEVNGNHYLCDGVGLVFLGVLFRGTRGAETWLRVGREIVLSELPLQVSDDGVDFEQSVAYHRLVLEGFLTALLLMRAAGEKSPREAWARLERMHEFVCAYTRPDGSVPLIGDADDGRIQKLGAQSINDHRYLLSTAAVVFSRGDFKSAAGRFHEESFWMLGPGGAAAFDGLPAEPLKSGVVAFPRGGFFVVRSPDVHLFIDGAEVGMRGRGGHGHNDVLSFELWVNGTTLITDCGAFLYTASRTWRNTFRSTAFHNVVQVDDEELNRFIESDAPHALWQLQYDAKPDRIAWRENSDACYWRGSHSGYERLVPPIRVSREFLVVRHARTVAIRDRVDGGGHRKLTWRFHTGAGVRVEPAAGAVRLLAGAQEFWLERLDADVPVRISPGWISPSYGIKREIDVVECEMRVGLPAAATFAIADRRLTASEKSHVMDELDRARDGVQAQPVAARRRDGV